MTFLAPGFFLASLAVAAAIVALHFIVTRQPRAGILPTARFVPDLPATATARATRPTDLLLLLLRVLLVLAAGVGLARPVLTPSRAADARVILADVSRAVGDIDALRDSVRGNYRDGDALIVFDSSARPVAENAPDSIGSLARTSARGNLSAALIAAVRAASALRETADSIELVVISPFGAEEIDAATTSVRQLWPGRARLVNAGVRPATASLPSTVRIRGSANDPLAVTAQLVSTGRATIVRDGSPAADTSSTGAVVDWPVAARPVGSIPRASRDTVGAVTAGASLVVAGFERRWEYPADSLRGAEVIARWIDGEPAAIEWPSGGGCARSVAIPVPAVGDLVIRTDFVYLVGVLSGPCASERPFTPMSIDTRTTLAGTGGLASREEFNPRGDSRSALAPWFLALALIAAIAELFVRRRKYVAVGQQASRDSRMRSAA